MENLVATASQYGALGLSLFASFWYINKKDEEHKTEREEWNTRIETMHSSSLKAIDNNTSVLSEIATIIKNK
jgi:hypothetical protein